MLEYRVIFRNHNLLILLLQKHLHDHQESLHKALLQEWPFLLNHHIVSCSELSRLVKYAIATKF